MVRLNSIFGSNMVLQALAPVRFFGDGCGKVAVTLDGVRKEAEADGEWLVEFDPFDYGGPFDITVELDGIFMTLKNVYFGDVILLGGQSNMQFKLYESSESKENYRANENVRLYTVDRMETGERFSSRDGWVPLSLENAPYFSAIGYYVGQGLASKDRKIGLIACYQGASVIQSWMPRVDALVPEFKIENRFADHEWFPVWNDDGVLWENMISKIVPFSFNTALWYQGESNASVSEADIYVEFLRALINSWRREFRNEKMRFIIVQLADHLDRAGYAWEKIQAEQLRAQDVIPNVSTVICRDVCDNIDIHPKEKDILSQRIVALLK
ncbi:MAG: hypothetical protein IJC80_06845 [Clostridia bacterium]|nr:hypothetical protein [Clostridia bacterium]